jgi:hypothetical protein
MSKSHTNISRAASLCEEFCDYVLYDDIHRSIIVNINVDRFSILRKELKKFKFQIKHMTKFEETESITCVFIQV